MAFLMSRRRLGVAAECGAEEAEADNLAMFVGGELHVAADWSKQPSSAPRVVSFWEAADSGYFFFPAGFVRLSLSG
jgi:hypothetical protein